jgi:hypothetical protein
MTHRDLFVAMAHLEDAQSVRLSHAFLEQLSESLLPQDDEEQARFQAQQAASRQSDRLADDDPKVTLMEAMRRLRERGVTDDALASAMDRADVMALLAANPAPAPWVLTEDFLFTFQLTFDEDLIGCQSAHMDSSGCGEVSLFDKKSVPWCFQANTAWDDVDWNLLRLRVFVTNPVSWCTVLLYDWTLEDPMEHLISPGNILHRTILATITIWRSPSMRRRCRSAHMAAQFTTSRMRDSTPAMAQVPSMGVSE